MGSLKASNPNLKVGWPQGHRGRLMCTMCPFFFWWYFSPLWMSCISQKVIRLAGKHTCPGKTVWQAQRALGLAAWEGISRSTLDVSTRAGRLVCEIPATKALECPRDRAWSHSNVHSAHWNPKDNIWVNTFRFVTAQLLPLREVITRLLTGEALKGSRTS